MAPPDICALQTRERWEEGPLEEPEVVVDRRQDRALRVGPAQTGKLRAIHDELSMSSRKTIVPNRT